MKKMLSLAVTMAMTAVLAACSSSPAETDRSSAGGEGSSEEGVTIEYWHINSETQGGPVVEELIEEFNETNDQNITVEGKFIANAYEGVSQNLQAELAVGEYPGVVQVGWVYLNYFAENFPQYVSPETIIKDYVPEDEGYLEDTFEQNIIDLGTSVNGTMVGLPYAASTPVVFYNADLFREAGLDPDDPPETLEEWIAAGQAVKDSTGNEGLYYELADNAYTLCPMIMGTGTEVYQVNGDGNMEATFYTPESVAMFEMWQAGFESGACSPLGSEEGLGVFAAGKMGATVQTIAKLSYMQESCDFDLRTAPFPRTGDEEDYTVCVGGNMLACFSEDENEIKACWEFMKFLYEDESMAKWVIGTGYLPVTRTAAENSETLQKFLDENELIQASLETWGDAGALPSWTGTSGMNVEQVLVDMRDSITLAYEDPDTVVREAQDEANGLLGN